MVTTRRAQVGATQLVAPFADAVLSQRAHRLAEYLQSSRCIFLSARVGERRTSKAQTTRCRRCPVQRRLFSTPGADARQACARKLRVPDAFAHRLTWARSRKSRGCSPTSTYSTLTMHVSAASRAATVAARSLRRPLATLNNAPPAGKRCVLCTVFTL